MSRTTSILAAASVFAATFTATGLSGAAPSALAASPSVRAQAADDFVDSIGVATHLTYGDTLYGNRTLVAQRLKESGIRHIRDGWGTGSSYANTFVRDTLGPLGVGITMVHDPRNNATATQHKDMVKNELLGVIDGVESLNEWDTRGAGWASYARDWTIKMSQAYRGDPATAKVPLLGPSMADTNNATNHAAMGDLSPYVDFGNTHDYPGNQYQMTDQIIDTVKRNVGLTAPGRGIIATETGFSNGSVEAPYPATPEAQAAVALPKVYLDHFRRGIARTFSYELLDQFPDGKFESRFGLVRNDGTPKPAFKTMAALTALLSDRGPDFAPGALNFSLSGTDANTRTLLLQKRDGSFWLALWQQEKVWNGASVLDPADRPVTLTLDQVASTVKVHNLTSGTPVQVRSGVSSLALESSEHVTVVEIAGLGAPTATAPVPAPAPTPTVAPSPVPTAPAPAPAPVTSGSVAFVSDLPWTRGDNGWGPAERNKSNGEGALNDGTTLRVGGRSFTKGIGVHAASNIVLAVNGAKQFSTSVGVDDETSGRGSVTFQVWADGVKLADSGVLRGGQAAKQLTVDVTGRRELRLVATDGGDGTAFDHGDWADAKLTS